MLSHTSILRLTYTSFKVTVLYFAHKIFEKVDNQVGATDLIIKLNHKL